MGGRGSRTHTHTVVEYRTPPEVLESLNRSNARVQQLQEQLKSMKDPQQIKIHVAKLKQIFWNDLRQQKFTLNQGKSVIFVGRTSVGKSSLLNVLFKVRQATSKGSCTKQISIVTTFGEISKNNLISVFDCPGLDQHFDLIKDPYKIPKFMGPLSDIYYLYDSILQEDIIKTFMAMNKKVYLVRTKCDPDDDPAENQQLKITDSIVAQKLGLKTKIYFTSKKGGEDNQKLLNDILS